MDEKNQKEETEKGVEKEGPNARRQEKSKQKKRKWGREPRQRDEADRQQRGLREREEMKIHHS